MVFLMTVKTNSRGAETQEPPHPAAILCQAVRVDEANVFEL